MDGELRFEDALLCRIGKFRILLPECTGARRSRRSTATSNWPQSFIQGAEWIPQALKLTGGVGLAPVPEHALPETELLVANNEPWVADLPPPVTVGVVPLLGLATVPL